MFNFVKTFTKEDFKITPILMDGKEFFLLTEIESLLGYSDLTCSIITSGEFIKDVDYLTIDGSSLCALKVLIESIGNTFGAGLSVDTQSLTVLTEFGLYACLLKSRNPKALAFRIWITSEVIPAIRKTSGYVSRENQSKEKESVEILECRIKAAKLLKCTEHFAFTESVKETNRITGVDYSHLLAGSLAMENIQRET